jgi:uncharacterized membrane protein
MQDTEPVSTKPRVTGRAREAVIALDRRILWLARHWVLAFNLFVGVYVGLPFLAPALMAAGLPAPARVLYGVYSGLCHQLGYRSFFLFGERLTYPRDIFQQYSGIDPNFIEPNGYPTGFWESRAFVGNAQMGYKVALCERDVAIYGVILLAGMVYAVPWVRRRVKPLHWALWILIGLGPIAFDGFSQLFSQYPYNQLALFKLFPYRESTALLRVLTGGLFGLANVWLAYPYVEESMREIKLELEDKLARVDQVPSPQSVVQSQGR